MTDPTPPERIWVNQIERFEGEPKIKTWIEQGQFSDALYEGRGWVLYVPEAKLDELRAELEQRTVQLAGCATAALGIGEVASKGDYGWSQAYQDVLELRAEATRLRENLRGVEGSKRKSERLRGQRDEARTQAHDLAEALRQIEQKLAGKQGANRAEEIFNDALERDGHSEEIGISNACNTAREALARYDAAPKRD